LELFISSFAASGSVLDMAMLLTANLLRGMIAAEFDRQAEYGRCH
jgi:hypothetical protein